jgi:hypothetical protein
LKAGSFIILLNRLSIFTFVTLELGVINLGSYCALENLSSFYFGALFVLMFFGRVVLSLLSIFLISLVLLLLLPVGS